MNIPSRSFLKFAYLGCFAGAFAALSYFCFAALIYFSNPELQKFALALKSNDIFGWFSRTLNSGIVTALLFLLGCAFLAGLGFILALFSKYVAKQAEKALGS